MAERRLRNGMLPSEMAIAGRLGAHLSWARTPARASRTGPARQAAAERFERQVRAEHPDLDDEQVAIRAEHLRKAEMSRIALLSVQARRNKRAAAVTTRDGSEGDRDGDTATQAG